MQESAKYLIHATVEADGVVERSDVVGAVFGQTEGLLGDELDLRALKESSKVGRIHVEIDSQHGRSQGELTIASDLDKVETAVLAAGLETIERVGPCRAEVRVTDIEDVRAAKRRDVVDRAKELLATSFDDSVPSTQELLDEVRQSVRVEDATDYEGLPAGPNVATSDAIIVVEGRADVLQLLKYGIKNAIAVEGTDVPDAVGDLTEGRTVTAFFDGDRGGDLILEELSQVGAVDYVALAPPGKPVEDLERHEVMTALREKVPYDVLQEGEGPPSVAATDGSIHPAPAGDAGSEAGPDAGANGAETRASDADAAGDADGGTAADGAVEPAPAATAEPAAGTGAETADDEPADSSAEAGTETETGTAAERASGEASAEAAGDTGSESTDADGAEPEGSGAEDAESEKANAEAGGDGNAPATVRGHVEAVVGGGTGTVRLLDEDAGGLGEWPAEEAFERVESADPVPTTLVLDGVLEQRVLDVAAQRGVRQVIAHEFGDFVKRPTNVRIRTAEQVLAS